jgi:hypothetical protein
VPPTSPASRTAVLPRTGLPPVLPVAPPPVPTHRWSCRCYTGWWCKECVRRRSDATAPACRPSCTRSPPPPPVKDLPSPPTLLKVHRTHSYMMSLQPYREKKQQSCPRTRPPPPPLAPPGSEAWPRPRQPEQRPSPKVIDVVSFEPLQQKQPPVRPLMQVPSSLSPLSSSLSVQSVLAVSSSARPCASSARTVVPLTPAWVREMPSTIPLSYSLSLLRSWRYKVVRLSLTLSPLSPSLSSPQLLTHSAKELKVSLLVPLQVQSTSFVLLLHSGLPLPLPLPLSLSSHLSRD